MGGQDWVVRCEGVGCSGPENNCAYEGLCVFVCAYVRAEYPFGLDAGSLYEGEEQDWCESLCKVQPQPHLIGIKQLGNH